MLSILATCDGVLLIGGRDYNPQLYGEAPSATVIPLDIEREEFDLRLLKHLVNRTKLPILGICGGLQLINIHFGGSLIKTLKRLTLAWGKNTAVRPSSPTLTML
jgi:putative glutamine amidotransferase